MQEGQHHPLIQSTGDIGAEYIVMLGDDQLFHHDRFEVERSPVGFQGEDMIDGFLLVFEKAGVIIDTLLVYGVVHLTGKEC